MTDWRLPIASELLDEPELPIGDPDNIRAQGHLLASALAQHGVSSTFEGAYHGAAMIQYLLRPEMGLRHVFGVTTAYKARTTDVERLDTELASALGVPAVKIVAPVPEAGCIGLEIPNPVPYRVLLKPLLERGSQNNAPENLHIVLGETVRREAVIHELAQSPHLLIAGITGSGKSVCIHALITYLLLTQTPDSLQLLLASSTASELSLYDGVPHLLSPICTDFKRVNDILHWLVLEAERRQHLLLDTHARDLSSYNWLSMNRGQKSLPRIVFAADCPLDSLLLEGGRSLLPSLVRIASLGRLLGIHLVLATQSVRSIPHQLLAVIPARLCFAINNQVERRNVLGLDDDDQPLIPGEMFYTQVCPRRTMRLRGVFVQDYEIERVVHYWRFFKPDQAIDPASTLERPNSPLFQPHHDHQVEAVQDELLWDAERLVQEHGRCSVSLLQRRLRIGYSRASRIVEQLESKRLPCRECGNEREL